MRNAWAIYGREEGCSDHDPLRFMVIRYASDTLVALVVHRGQSLTSPSIMSATSAMAALAGLHAVKKIDAACDDNAMRMERTRIDQRDAGLGPEHFGIRHEAWTYAVCKRQVEVPVTFKGGGDGGAHRNVEGSAALVLPKP